MKNKIFNCFVLFTFFILFNQCKKDYPDDIPKWIKTEIQKFKKITPDCICHYSGGYNPSLSITEYTVNNEKVYEVIKNCGYHGPSVDIYDYYGKHWNGCITNYVNGFINVDAGYIYCSMYVQSHCTSTRKIWSGKMY
ncbi:MAG: hypothetical protein PHD97_03955 [Bacteroidales bacterium]|nr:hypothetical protein [Bacteroidales bacterium]